MTKVKRTKTKKHFRRNRIIPHLYSEPSLPRTVCMSTPYISRFFALFKKESSAWAGV